MKATKATACYIRYSSHRQDGNTTIETQIEACHRAAGGPCTDYIDKAKTGRSIAGRQSLLRLIEDAEEGKIARVFVYKVTPRTDGRDTRRGCRLGGFGR